MAVTLIGPLLALFALAAVVMLVIGLVRATSTATGNVFTVPGVASVARHLRRWRLVTVLIALAVGFVAFQWGNRPSPSLGRWAAVAPGIVMVALLVGTALGELTSPRQRAQVRSASLEVRRPLDAVGRRQAAITGSGLAVLVGTLAFTTMRAVPDGQGRAGRAIATRRCAYADGHEVPASGLTSPFPGSWYSLPIGIAFVIGLVLAGVCLWLIARRPRPGAEAAPYDDELRRWSGAQVLHAVGLGIGATLAPVAVVTAFGLSHMHEGCRGGSLSLVPLGFVAIAVAALLWSVAELALLFTGPRRVALPASPMATEALR